MKRIFTFITLIAVLILTFPNESVHAQLDYPIISVNTTSEESEETQEIQDAINEIINGNLTETAPEVIVNTNNEEPVIIPEVSQGKTIRILCIGNSHTRSSFRYLYKIFKEAGYDKVIVAHGFINGSHLSDHMKHYKNEDRCYDYFKYTSENPHLIYMANLRDIVKDEPWDYILIQQNTNKQAKFKSYTSARFDISEFMDLIENDCTNPNMQFGLVTPWSKTSDFDEEYFNKVFKTAENQYKVLQKTGRQLMKYDSRFIFRINTGEAFDKARQNEKLCVIGNELLGEDNTHLEPGMPKYLAAYCIAKYFGIDDIDWYPDYYFDNQIKTETSAELAAIARQIVDDMYK